MRYPFLIGFILLSLRLSAQSRLDKDTFRMKEVELNALKNQDKERLKTIRMDSTILNNHQTETLADLLTQSSVFVKEYGPGMSATPSFRGTSYDQTKIYWNNIPLNSSMYGTQDLNLIPVFLLDGIDIHYGGASLVNGSGGFGGSIDLISDSKNQPYRAEFISSAGSFGKIENGLSVNYGTNKCWASTKIYEAAAQNNFPYINNFQWGNPVQTETDAATNEYGILQSFGIKPTEKDIITANIWYQNADRHLPQTMISDLNHEFQRDASLRTDVNFRHYETRYNWEIDGSYANEYLFYHNELEGINEPGTNQRYNLKADINPEFKWPIHLNAGMEDIEEVANIQEYNGAKERNRLGLFENASYDLSTGWQIGLVARAEEVNFKTTEPAFTASTSYKLIKKDILNIYMNAGRNYNYPNLNDLYWYPGGNANLQPEHTWFGEAGLHADIPVSKANSIHSDIAVFSNWVDNYILWTPGSGSIWQAQNLKKVWARGLEASLEFVHSHHSWYYEIKGAFQYTPSTDQSLLSAYDQTLGTQLIYIPLLAAQAQFNAAYKAYSVSVEYSYTGGRNTTDIPLPGYALVNIYLARAFKIYKMHFTLTAKCYNLFNESYQAIIWRPMPGRWYELSLKADLWK